MNNRRAGNGRGVQRLQGQGNPLLTFSAVSIIIKLVAMVVVVWCIGRLAFSWSLQETARLTHYAVGDEYGPTLAWLIQLSPILLLAMRAMSPDKTWRKAYLIMAIAIAGIDVVTNLSAYQNNTHFYDGDDRNMMIVGDFLGYSVAAGIVLGEEVMALAIGGIFHMLALLIVTSGRGRSVPRWMIVGTELGFGMSGVDALGVQAPEVPQGGPTIPGPRSRPDLSNTPPRSGTINARSVPRPIRDPRYRG
jgi:hypothetical protein